LAQHEGINEINQVNVNPSMKVHKKWMYIHQWSS